MTTLNNQSSFLLQFTISIPYFEGVQTLIRKIGMRELSVEELNECLVRVTVPCNNLQEAALLDTLIKRIV